MKKKFFCLCFVIGMANSGISQEDTAFSTVMFSVNYSFHVPHGDLADRFGWSSAATPGAIYKFRSNWLIGLEGSVIFGGNVKEDTVLDYLRNSRGNITGEEGFPADLNFMERGFSFHLTGGRIFSLSEKNPNSGIFALAGPGFMQHKIIVESMNDEAPQIRGEYRKGYDRLSNGFSAKIFAGYINFSKVNAFNFWFGIEGIFGLLRNRRSWDYDAGKNINFQRKDFLLGFRFGYNILIRKKEPKKIYYY